jgi:hypothetical protein
MDKEIRHLRVQAAAQSPVLLVVGTCISRVAVLTGFPKEDCEQSRGTASFESADEWSPRCGAGVSSKPVPDLCSCMIDKHAVCSLSSSTVVGPSIGIQEPDFVSSGVCAAWPPSMHLYM